MDTSKVNYYQPKQVHNQIFFFENEVGLSSYDLALISIDKITNKSKSNINYSLKTYF